MYIIFCFFIFLKLYFYNEKLNGPNEFDGIVRKNKIKSKKKRVIQ